MRLLHNHQRCHQQALQQSPAEPGSLRGEAGGADDAGAADNKQRTCKRISDVISDVLSAVISAVISRWWRYAAAGVTVPPAEDHLCCGQAPGWSHEPELMDGWMDETVRGLMLSQTMTDYEGAHAFTGYD